MNAPRAVNFHRSRSVIEKAGVTTLLQSVGAELLKATMLAERIILRVWHGGAQSASHALQVPCKQFFKVGVGQHVRAGQPRRVGGEPLEIIDGVDVFAVAGLSDKRCEVQGNRCKGAGADDSQHATIGRKPESVANTV